MALLSAALEAALRPRRGGKPGTGGGGRTRCALDNQTARSKWQLFSVVLSLRTHPKHSETLDSLLHSTVQRRLYSVFQEQNRREVMAPAVTRFRESVRAGIVQLGDTRVESLVRDSTGYIIDLVVRISADANADAPPRTLYIVLVDDASCMRSDAQCTMNGAALLKLRHLRDSSLPNVVPLMQHVWRAESANSAAQQHVFLTKLLA
jgi:hypothetical protein